MGAIYVVEMTAKLDQCAMRSGGPSGTGGGTWHASVPIAYDGTKVYEVTGSVRRSATANGAMYMGLTFLDANGVDISSSWIAASGVTPGTSWATYTGTLGAGAAPGGTAFIAVTVVLNHYLGTVGYHECQSLRVALSTTPTVALNGDEFMRDSSVWVPRTAGVAVFARLPDGTPYTETLRFATQGFMTRPSDTPANTYIDGRLKQPALFRQEMPQSYAGAVTVGYGEMTLANPDGALSHLTYAGLDAQVVRLLVGDTDAAFSSFLTVFTATTERAVFDADRLVVRLKDGLSRLDLPLLPNFFAGNNALPNGLEGGSEIKGLPKPKLFGRVLNLPPPCVNSSRLIYLVSDGGFGATGSVTAVYDRGVTLTAGATYASQADMETNAPTAGQYRVWPAGGMVRLGSTPAGQVTCDAQASGTNTNNYWSPVLLAIAQFAGLPGGSIDIWDDSPPYDPDNWSPVDRMVGLWVHDTRTGIEAMELIAKGCGAFFGWMTRTSNGYDTPKLCAFMFPHPYSLRDDDTFAGFVHYPQEAVLAVRPVTPPDEGAGVPVWRVRVGYSPVMQVQEFDVDGAVGVDRRSFIANERRQTSASDSAIKTKHPNALTYEVATQILDEAAAAQEATRQLQLRRYPRAWFDVTVALAGALASSGLPRRESRPRIGGYVRLAHRALVVMPHSGVPSTDSYFNVMALEFDYRRGTARMTVRQATEPTL